MEKKNFGQEKVLLGIKTIVLGLVLYVLEFLSLPIFGAIHKAQVDGRVFTVISGNMLVRSLIRQCLLQQQSLLH